MSHQERKERRKDIPQGFCKSTHTACGRRSTRVTLYNKANVVERMIAPLNMWTRMQRQARKQR